MGGHNAKSQNTDIQPHNISQCGQRDKIVALATTPNCNSLTFKHIKFTNVATDFNETSDTRNFRY